MISKIECYVMHCDRCGKLFYYHNVPTFDSKELLEIAANIKSWDTIGGKNYCPNCYDFNNEHEPVPKK